MTEAPASLLQAQPQFIPLRMHSSYSMLEGAIHVKAMAKLCEKAGVPAAALTDHGNLFGALEFSETLRQGGDSAHRRLSFAFASGASGERGRRSDDPASGAKRGGLSESA